MTGSIFAQAIPIAISPILTRLYNPNDFGVFALYFSLTSIFSSMVTGKYEMAIMLPKRDKDAANVFMLALIITFITTLLTFLIILVFENEIIAILEAPSLTKLIYIVPFSVLFTGIYQCLNVWNNRKKNYKQLAMSKITQSTVIGASNISGGVSGLGASGIIFANLIGQIASTSYLAYFTYKIKTKFKNQLNRARLLILAKKYNKFPKYNLPNVLIDNFRMSGMNMLIAKYFSSPILGQFSLAWRMVQAPIVLIGGSLGQVFFQKVSTVEKEDLYSIIIKYLTRSALIAIPIFSIVFIFSSDIFVFVFGEKWKIAGDAASIMAPWVCINFISSPLVSIMLVLNRQESVLVFSIFYALTPLGIIYLMNNSNFLNMLTAVTYSMSLLLLIFSVIIIYFAKKEKN